MVLPSDHFINFDFGLNWTKTGQTIYHKIILKMDTFFKNINTSTMFKTEIVPDGWNYNDKSQNMGLD